MFAHPATVKLRMQRSFAKHLGHQDTAKDAAITTVEDVGNIAIGEVGVGVNYEITLK